jgi:hypothetical protein
MQIAQQRLELSMAHSIIQEHAHIPHQQHVYVITQQPQHKATTMLQNVVLEDLQEQDPLAELLQMLVVQMLLKPLLVNMHVSHTM